MYGYVRPRKGELRVRELEQYQAAYCGLCHDLGRRYGLAARFLVNYDLTFFYCLLTACLPPQTLTKRFCPANPFCKKTCAGPDEAMDYASDLCVLLGWHKLEDVRADDGFFRRAGAGLAKLILRRAYRKAAKSRPEEERDIQTHLSRLSRLEQERCPELDRPAEEFASILAACAGWFRESELRRPAEQLLYHLGRFVYLCDAWDDLEQDRKRGGYNPVALRYGVRDGTLDQAQKESLTTTLTHSIHLAASALELLPLRWGKGLLENIIYLGLPGVLQSVSDGTFRSNKDRSTV